MTVETALWLGIFGGTVIGVIGTWISFAIAILIGRHLRNRANHLRNRADHLNRVIHEPSTNTFDNNLRDLIAREKQKP